MKIGFLHSFFKHYPEVRTQYFGFVVGLTEVMNNRAKHHKRRNGPNIILNINTNINA